MDSFTAARDKSQWDWTMMLMVPGTGSTKQIFESAVSRAAAKTPLARIGEVRLESLSEGLCVQTLHIGSFDDEAAVLERMHHEFIPENGLHMKGKHHENLLQRLPQGCA